MNSKYAEEVLNKEKKVVARQEKYLNSIVYGTVVIFILFASVTYYWLTKEYKLFTFNKVTVQKGSISPGEAVVFKYDYCKHVDTPVKTESKLVGTYQVYDRPTMTNSQKKGCYKFDIPVVILEDRNPDTYHFHYTLCSKVNPIREVCEEHISPMFKVATESAR